ncbi:tRNA (adenosine(37)-N6)-dimethylallyltransferase MiaA [uncultured Vagococcus sp.]|uniref:tRNA (adenosine(37)-N6)-dimethylallyltransferase MiaA n=1 Tax=uncultured Vagococcus sp. TaxID=189676 RepID=UPI0028D43DB6|nr:tRNA (adenosine(37)-N6)-dimethylallyltransferase MiaA [uncultured Vagococcus sp.]
MVKEKVLVIVGPTAVGKTALSVELAKALNGEIISGDSLQVYRGLDVGTAKATVEERQGIPHYLLDVRDQQESFSVADFQVLGRQYLADCHRRGKLPIVVGGTGLYIQSLLFDFELGGQSEALDTSELRQELTVYWERCGTQKLWERLRDQDQGAAEVIHPNNVKRVIRAIEVIELTGKSLTEQVQVDYHDLENALYDVKLIGLTTERENLYQRINQRVELMMEAGVLEEARGVYGQEGIQGAQGIGYKEFFPYFQGESNLETAVTLVKQNSRRYAKRQLTWFRNRMSVEWWDLVAHPESLSELQMDVANWLEK